MKKLFATTIILIAFSAPVFAENGLKFTSQDGAVELKFRAYAQIDYRDYIGGTNKDDFLIRSSRPILEGKYNNDFAARVMLDFGNGQTRLLDAYADYKPDPLYNFRFGKFKTPIGLERLQSEQELLFAERGLATNLVPFRDVGVEVYGKIIPQNLEYQIALTGGAADGRDDNADSDNSKDITARIFMHPLPGFGVGIAGSYGNRNGSGENSALASGYKSAGQKKFFKYSAGTFADGTTTRINPELYYSYGPLGIFGDYLIESQEVTKTTSHARLENTAYTAVASYVLTGEEASFDGVKPAENFNPSAGLWGAWEVLGRYGQLHVDNDTYPTFATITSAANTAKESTIGLNWYLNPDLKFNFDYSNTAFEGGANGGDRPDEQAFISRAQFRF